MIHKELIDHLFNKFNDNILTKPEYLSSIIRHEAEEYFDTDLTDKEILDIIAFLNSNGMDSNVIYN